LLTRIEHDRVFHPAAHLDADRHGERREAVHEVRGAVERVDDPDHVAVARCAAFLGEDRVVGVQPADRLDDVGFGRAVDLGHVVVAPLRMDFDGLEARDGAHDDVAGAARGSDCDVQERLHSDRGGGRKGPL
jgi:hypothetical protein